MSKWRTFFFFSLFGIYDEISSGRWTDNEFTEIEGATSRLILDIVGKKILSLTVQTGR